MKKLITILVCIGLASHSISAITRMSAWRCKPSNPDVSCPQKEREEAESWFRNANLQALKSLTADLAAVGIAVPVNQLQKEQDIAAEKLIQPSDQFKEVHQKLEEMERQKQKVIERIAG